jgi:dephospho-CoA kinase
MQVWINPDNPEERGKLGEPLRGILRKYVPADEHVVLWLHPSPWFIFLRSLWVVILVVLLAAGVRYAAGVADLPQVVEWAGWVGVVIVAGVVVWQTLEWLSRLYVLTDKRMIAVAGVMRQSVTDMPLRNIRNVVIVRSLLDRLLGLGTLGAATAGTSGYEMVWVELDRPTEVMRVVRKAVDESQGIAPHRHEDAGSRGLLVLGLTGGIGAGKSEVASVLSELGFLVVDSDKDAKEALQRPEVKAELVKWWGPQVLDADGNIDRKAVATIVFADPEQRTRLEGLIHPLVKAGRAELVRRAAAEGRPGVVIDAPLLFEAGSDRECDAVMFVDAPREQRVERLRASRGWDEDELARREKAQLSLEEKRKRSDVVVVNDSTREVLKGRVEAALQKLKEAGTRREGRGTAPPLGGPAAGRL